MSAEPQSHGTRNPEPRTQNQFLNKRTKEQKNKVQPDTFSTANSHYAFRIALSFALRLSSFVKLHQPPTTSSPSSIVLRPSSIIALTLLIASLLAILLGLSIAPYQVTLRVDDPQAGRYLRDFRGTERNETDAYRWSYSNSTINLSGFAAAPAIVDLRLTSPRPADEPPADMQLARGRWESSIIPVRGDWRRYRVLVPVSGEQPELDLPTVTFRPDERDRRSLGVALSRLAISIPATSSRTLTILASLGPWRLLLLLAIPPVVYALALSFFGKRQSSQWLSLPPALIALALMFTLAADPLNLALGLSAQLAPMLLAVLLGVIWLPYRQRIAPATSALQRLLDSDRARLWIVLATGFATGLAMLTAVPAWAHFDESAHFEYAWLLANHPAWPTPGTSDPRIAAYGGGGRAIHHQPLYYLLVSLPLRLASSLDIPAQLSIARYVSFSLMLLVVWMAERMSTEMTMPGQPLRWLAPLALVLNPTFATSMTSVNSDVAAITACTWAAWGMAQTLVRGLTWRRAIWLISAIPLAMLCKNIGAVLLVLVPFAIGIAIWRHQGWRWRYLLLGGALAGGALLAPSLAWSDPALWYRWGTIATQPAQRAARPGAPAGEHVMQLQPVSVPNYEGLSSPILDGSRLSSRKVTVGAWVWANRPAQIWGPGVIYATRDVDLAADMETIQVGTEPRFVAATFDLPPRLMFVHAMVWSVVPGDIQPLEVYVDGVVMAVGEYPAGQPPQLEGPDMTRGVWEDRPFENLIRNGDMEDGWVFLRPQVEQFVSRYARRSLSRVVANIADLQRTVYLELRDYAPWLVFNSFGSFAERIVLRDPLWQYIITGTFFLAAAGILLHIRQFRRTGGPYRIAYVTLGLGSLAVWIAILLAHIPPEFPSGIPSARYGFTVIVPSMLLLAFGWLGLWPERHRSRAAVLLLTGMLLLTITAVDTIRLYEHTVCVRDEPRCAYFPAPSLLDLLVKPQG